MWQYFINNFWEYFVNNFWETNWYISPVKHPCEQCGKNGGPNLAPRKCQYKEVACATKFRGFPIFREHKEATSIQLFYDLFFVANLSICTTNHPIKDRNSLITYVGFFTLLWFTWFSTILFDVRFTIDSWFTRLNKASSFTVMTAFAMSTVYFDNADPHFGHDARYISFILMGSRLVLAIQYGITTIVVYRRCHRFVVIVPFALSIAVSFLASLIYLVLALTTTSNKKSYGHIGWYITSLIEAIVLLLISYHWDNMMNFEGSNIVERMGALTLIIIGEGIIGMTEAISFILKNSTEISSSSVGLVVAAILTIYMVWMLYFDHADKLDEPGRRITTKKPFCQIWTFLHFPLHSAILLTLEANSRFVYWWNAFSALQNAFPTVAEYNATNGSQLAGLIHLQMEVLNQTYPLLTDIIDNTDVQHNLTALSQMGGFDSWDGSSDNEMSVRNAVNNIFTAIINKMSDLFDVEVSQGQVGLDGSDRISQVYTNWYITFFVAAGCVLVFLALARYIADRGEEDEDDGKLLRSRRPLPWLAITLQGLIGISLALVSLMALPRYYDNLSNFMSGPWIIPTVLLSFLSVIVIDNFLYYWPSETRKSNILHPPGSEGPPEDKDLKIYKAELKRLQRLLHDLGKDPTSGTLLGNRSTSPTNGRSGSPTEKFNVEIKGPYLSLPSQEHELELVDNTSTRVGYSDVSEVPLLDPTNLAVAGTTRRESDAISARTEYSRLTGVEQEEEGEEV